VKAEVAEAKSISSQFIIEYSSDFFMFVNRPMPRQNIEESAAGGQVVLEGTEEQGGIIGFQTCPEFDWIGANRLQQPICRGLHAVTACQTNSLGTTPADEESFAIVQAVHLRPPNHPPNPPQIPSAWPGQQHWKMRRPWCRDGEQE